MSSLVPIPLPLGGLNTINPFVEFESGYARELTNFSIYNGRLYIRPAVRSHVYNAGLGTNYTHWYDVNSIASGTFAILVDGKIRKLSDGSGATTIGGSPSYNPTTVNHFGTNYLIGARQPRLAANPFTAWTFTTAAVTATSTSCACSHKGRLYVAEVQTIEYSPLAAVTGAMEAGFSLGEFLSGQDIIRMFSVSASDPSGTQNLFVVFGDEGRVLVYQGDHPGSATWSLVGKYDMPAPVANQSFLEIDGDIWVSTTTGAYWFKDLLMSGAQVAKDNAPTRPIENIWSSVRWLGAGLTPEQPHTFYEPRLDAIITQCANKSTGTNNFAAIANYQTEAMLFVYFRLYKAWGVWLTTPFHSPVLADSLSPAAQLYSGSNRAEVKKLVHGNVVDQYIGSSTIDIEASWKTPYLSLKGNGIKLNGVRPFFENTISGHFAKMRAIFDYSDYNALLGWNTQSTVTAVVPGRYADGGADSSMNSWNQYNEFQGISGDGGALSINFQMKRKSGSSATQTQSIYAAFAHMTPQGELY